jgi:gamma-glutamyltranspeptidase/glutathione hydrolase
MTRGIIAAGHEATAGAAAEVMAAGGNAFDGICAALCAAGVAEPVLASLGGGGFLLAHPAGAEPVLMDFFTQTPRQRAAPETLDFFPVVADFGDTTQEFHIGLGAMAVPGAIAGLFAIQQRLCRLPAADLLEPARRLAADGVVINPFQHRIARIVEPILRARPEYFALHASRRDPGRLAEPGERIRQPELASALETLARDGAGVLHGGPWGERLAADCAAHGGHLRLDDLTGYQVVERAPLALDYRDARLYLNPPPSIGGLLMGLTLDLLAAAGAPVRAFGSSAHRQRLARAMHLTQQARLDAAAKRREVADGLDPALTARYRELMCDGARFRRGTTQISIADADGNLASLTLSNGEGTGYLLPGTGIVMNNMLGEEDLNPHGFHRWPLDRRISSMMCPTLVRHADGGWTVTGSSGSNRIRSAILQVLCNLIDLGMPLDEAVAAPRIHVEDGRLNIEPPVPPDVLADLARDWPDLIAFREPNVFFGGAHSVAIGAGGELGGAGDNRRGGVVLEV